MIRTVALSLLLAVAMLAIAPATAAIVSPSSVVYLHDYLSPPNDLNCSTDVSPKIQTAINAWLSMQHERRGATLDLGSGCYRTSAPVVLGDPAGPGHFIFGDVHGDGPDLTVFRSSAMRGMTINEAKNMRIGGFSIAGPAPYNGSDNGLDGGLVIGRAAADLGSNGNTFHNIGVSNYPTCVMVGDSRTAGSAANNTFESMDAAHCSIGFHLVTWNTLNNVFDNTGCNTTNYCVWSTTAYGMTWRNGGGTNNGTVFYLATCCQFSVQNWR